MKLATAALAAILSAIFAGAAAAAGADDLGAVRRALLPLREGVQDPVTRMRPEFLAARDALRAWIDARLARFPQGGDAAAFTKALNADIVAADLSCVEAEAPGYNRCASPNELDARGYLGALDVARVRDLLIVQAETGVPCGFDETAYVYEWARNRWRRLLDTSQPGAAGGVYVAEQIEQIVFSRPDGAREDALLFAVTGVSPTCSDSYSSVHYRAWSVRRGGGAWLIVDGRENDAYVAARSPAVSARIEDGQLLLEMDVRSLDTSRLHRVAVRRFKFDFAQGARSERARAERVPPLALTPRDFVEEWLRAPWSTASAWTPAAAREALAVVHREASANPARARFTGPTQRCEGDPAAVQVGLRFAAGETFFRVRNDAAGAYLMLGAASVPAPDCARADSSLDTPRSLF